MIIVLIAGRLELFLPEWYIINDIDLSKDSIFSREWFDRPNSQAH